MPTQKLPMLSRMQFGIIDQQYMNTLATRSNEFAEIEQPINRLIADRGALFGKVQLAEIVQVEEIATTTLATAGGEVGIAWRYTWKSVDLLADLASDDTTLPTQPSGDSGITTDGIQEVSGDDDADGTPSTAGYAYNLAELTNMVTDPIIFGIDVSSAEYPTTYQPVPVQGGAIVLLWRWEDTEGRLVYLFDRQGTHDGYCAP